jgi:acetate kinase
VTVLVLNSGSSSVKHEVFAVAGNGALSSVADGLVEGIGEAGAAAPDHVAAIDGVLSRLDAEGLLDDLQAVGHRVVHGGEAFTGPTVLDDDVIAEVEALSPLAPLHNPPALQGIRAARQLRPDVPHVAVFDTAFHATLPPQAFRYAVPEAWYADHGVRRYGFHGTSHAHVAARAAEALGRPLHQLKLITLHLGNGASACAVDGGRSVDTSMGLSPLEGLVMGTRSGDVDPAVVFHLLRAGMTADEVEAGLNRRSGLLGLAGANDMRKVRAAAAQGDPGARLALAVTARRLRKYVGAYLAVLGGLDALVFTAGIGEHDTAMRSDVAGRLEHLGLRLDEAANAAADPTAGPALISPPGATPAVLVVATDEERRIAEEVLDLLGRG